MGGVGGVRLEGMVVVRVFDKVGFAKVCLLLLMLVRVDSFRVGCC